MPQGMQAFFASDFLITFLIFSPSFRPRQTALAGRGSHQSGLRKCY